ncbi:hypothetical protein [Streptomyces virginiae]|uniref:hypothetical protein n=1 Tax=Streptomyces virginiae TaxID=1961 RepID=UPI002DBA3718|nr:hypothetical protein [Streptomyces sp. CMAA1738]MEC4574166.1 hypothetical protein [Streptomyces sp. CMAA1738]
MDQPLRQCVAGGPQQPDREYAVHLRSLAGRHATVVSADWYPLPQVLATVVPRGR